MPIGSMVQSAAGMRREEADPDLVEVLLDDEDPPVESGVLEIVPVPAVPAADRIDLHELGVVAAFVDALPAKSQAVEALSWPR